MARRPRLHLSGGFYHVILRGNGRQAIFFDCSDRLTWQSIVEQGLARYEHRLHAYCWMTNHVHMAIQAGIDPIASLMCFVASRYARYLNRKNSRSGHLFERRYKAILVQQNEYLLELIRYIHLNPVRAGMVADPIDYRWSSHSAYLHSKHVKWLSTEFIAAMLGSTRRSSCLAYAAFMRVPISKSVLQLLRSGDDSDDRVLGKKDWIETVVPNVGVSRANTNIDDLVDGYCRRHRVTEAALASASRSRKNSEIRARIAIAATEQRLATVTEIAKRFGRAHSGLSRAMNRLRDKEQ